jgi:hypothetical protein
VAEPELVYDPVFYLSQFSCCAAFDGEDVPSCTTGHSALCGFYECSVFMQAAVVSPTIGPRCLIVEIKKPVAQAQRDHYFGEHGYGVGRHPFPGAFALMIAVYALPGLLLRLWRSTWATPYRNSAGANVMSSGGFSVV